MDSEKPCECGMDDVTPEKCPAHKELAEIMKGPEPVLSPEDQAALDKLKCDVCELPGMKDGRCVLCIRCEGCDRPITRGGYIHSGMCSTCCKSHYD